jgi:membrane-bound lytic murein transglycosylase B
VHHEFKQFGITSVNIFLADMALPAPDTAAMAKKPEPRKATTWNIYKIVSKAVWLGAVEATEETSAMEKAAAEFKVPANRLMAIRR